VNHRKRAFFMNPFQKNDRGVDKRSEKTEYVISGASEGRNQYSAFAGVFIGESR